MNAASLPDDFPRLPTRDPESHKGDFGRVLIIGGSRGMSGAAALAGMAALRAGAGLVKIASADCCLDTVAAFEPSYMTIGLPHDDTGRIHGDARPAIEDLAASQTSIGCGPGLGRSESLDGLIVWMYQTLSLPIVFDADALNALSDHRDALASPGGPRVLTPHPGEFRRLTGDPAADLDQQQRQAVELARQCGVTIVLKGHRTLVTNGSDQYHNATGNPGMATGGSGDVLTGLIATLLAQQFSPYDAARLGVYLHGRAGDLAAEQLGQTSLIASDLVRFLPAATRDQAN